jgi:hypothetical protein
MPHNETNKSYDHDADFLCSLPWQRNRSVSVSEPADRPSGHGLYRRAISWLAPLLVATRTLNRYVLEIFGPMLALMACASMSVGLALLVMVALDVITTD